MSFVPENLLPDDFLPDHFLPEGVTEMTFIGPAIANLRLQVGKPMNPRNYASRFASPDPITFSVVGILPDGLSLSSSGVLSGTPTAIETASSLEIRGDDASTTVDSNSFAIDIVAATAQLGGVGSGQVGFAGVGSADVGGAGVTA